MSFVSITRLRVRAIRFLPFFALHAARTLRQVKRAPGFQEGSLLADRRWTYWTMTVWDTHDSMRRYMTAGSHKTAMPHLLNWCDESSVVHWDQVDSMPPSWEDAETRMRQEGRASKVRAPSPDHASLRFQAARFTRAVTIKPTGRSASTTR